MIYLFTHTSNTTHYHIFYSHDIDAVYTYMPQRKDLYIDSNFRDKYSVPRKVPYVDLELPNNIIIYAEQIVDNNWFARLVDKHIEKIIFENI